MGSQRTLGPLRWGSQHRVMPSSGQMQTLSTEVFWVLTGGDPELELLTSLGLFPEKRQLQVPGLFSLNV